MTFTIVTVSLLAATVTLAEWPADSFQRPESEQAGQTEKGDYTWVEVAEKDSKAVRIAENLLWLDYVAGASLGDGGSTEACANLDRFTAADVDIRVKVSAWYGDDVRVCGVSYRLDSVQGGFDAPGYHALLNQYCVRLTFGTNIVAEAKGSFPPKEVHDLRVVAEGRRHKIFVDGKLCLEASDGAKTRAGYVGLAQYYEQAKFDDFSVSAPSVDDVKKKN